jgi:hypothetical protein
MLLLQSFCRNLFAAILFAVPDFAPRLKRIVHHFENVQIPRAVCVGGHTHNIDLSMK